jgi:hypothetical protein
MKLADMFKPVPNAPELSKEEAQENLRQWASKNHPATGIESFLVTFGVAFFFITSYLIATNQAGLPPIANVQIEEQRYPNAAERAALESKMAKYHHPVALYNLLEHGEE